MPRKVIHLSEKRIGHTTRQGSRLRLKDYEMMRGNKKRADKTPKKKVSKQASASTLESMERKRRERMMKSAKREEKPEEEGNSSDEMVGVILLPSQEDEPMLACLPIETWFHIFSFLGTSWHLRRAAMVCTVWRDLALDQVLWTRMKLPYPSMLPRLKLLEMDRVVAHGRWTNSLRRIEEDNKRADIQRFAGGIVSAGGDGKVILWRTADKQRLKDFATGQQQHNQDGDALHAKEEDRGVKELVCMRTIDTGFTSIRYCTLIDGFLYVAVRENIYVWDPFSDKGGDEPDDEEEAMEGKEKEGAEDEKQDRAEAEKKKDNVAAGQPILKLSCHVDTVTCIVECFGCICSGSYDGSVVLWNKGSGEKAKILRSHPMNRILTMRRWKGMLAVGAIGEEAISLWDSQNHRHFLEAGGEGVGPVLCFQVWNDLLWSGSDTEIRGWAWDDEKKKGSCMFKFTGHEASVRVLEVWNGFLLSGCQDGSIKAWDDSGRSTELFVSEGTQQQASKPAGAASKGSTVGAKKGRKQLQKEKKKKNLLPSWYTLLPLSDVMLLGGVLTADGNVGKEKAPTLYLWHRVLLANPCEGFAQGEDSEDDEASDKENKLWHELLICD